MSNKPSPQIMEFMSAYGVDSDEIWQVHGRSWVVLHKALERVAAEKGIQFDAPTVIENNSADGIVAICVRGFLGDRSEWSIGEAAPKNNKNAYPYAMAEKRAKDRVILKLLNTHGVLYSEEEIEQENKPARLAKKDAKEVYAKLQTEMRDCASREQLKAWGTGNADRIHILPEDWEDTIRLQFEELMADLRQREAA